MKKKRERYTFGLVFTGLTIFMLIYTFFYTSTYQTFQGGPSGAWTEAMALSMTAVLAGMLMELSRFWGSVIEFKTDAELLILQGVPAAILGVIPGPFWLQAGGNTFPFIFFADPVVTAISGVWLGMVLFRGIFHHKKVKEEDVKGDLKGRTPKNI
jgi:predicted membrane-bound mannosyltransferase